MTAELWPDLVDRLCGRPNVRRVLAGLAHANAFVEESPGTPGGFRIHPLFREMLQAQLGVRAPGELAACTRVCADWYAEARPPPDAVVTRCTAEDWDFVTRLLIDDLLVSRLLAHGTDPALRGSAVPAPGLAGPGCRRHPDRGRGDGRPGRRTERPGDGGLGVRRRRRRPQLRLSATLASSSRPRRATSSRPPCWRAWRPPAR